MTQNATQPAGAAENAHEESFAELFEQEGNTTTTYKAVQLFKADADAGEAIHICWASEDVKAAVEGAIKANAGEGGYEGTTAQEAAEYISANWGADTGATAIIANATFANALADVVEGLDARVCLESHWTPWDKRGMIDNLRSAEA